MLYINRVPRPRSAVYRFFLSIMPMRHSFVVTVWIFNLLGNTPLCTVYNATWYLLFTQLSICTWALFFFFPCVGTIIDMAFSPLRASVPCLALFYCALALAVCPALLSLWAPVWLLGLRVFDLDLWWSCGGLTLPWEAKLWL